MNKQERINKFVVELGDFLDSYYSSQVQRISVEREGEWLTLSIEGENDSIIELCTAGEEITFWFSETHWHIDNYDEPCGYELIYGDTIEDVMNILQGNEGTYSCWLNGKAKGGATFYDSTMEEIVITAKDSFKKFDEIRIKTWGKKLEVIKIK